MKEKNFHSDKFSGLFKTFLVKNGRKTENEFYYLFLVFKLELNKIREY